MADWKPVQLLFVRGVNEPGEPEVGKKNWALFLCTDAKLGMSKVLEVYALRWGARCISRRRSNILGFLSNRQKTFCIPHRLYPSLCDSLPDAGSREVGMWRCPNW